MFYQYFQRRHSLEDLDIFIVIYTLIFDCDNVAYENIYGLFFFFDNEYGPTLDIACRVK